MKKTYISPSMEVIKVNVTNIIATSMAIYDETVNSSIQLGRENNSNHVW